MGRVAAGRGFDGVAGDESESGRGFAGEQCVGGRAKRPAGTIIETGTKSYRMAQTKARQQKAAIATRPQAHRATPNRHSINTPRGHPGHFKPPHPGHFKGSGPHFVIELAVSADRLSA